MVVTDRRTYRSTCSCANPGVQRMSALSHTDEHPVDATADVLDPVCGMTISPADAVGQVNYKGQTYHFCATSCLEQFRADPERFVDPGRKEERPPDDAD